MLDIQRNLTKKITEDTYNELIFRKCKKDRIYLVGGYVRDVLRSVQTKDRDYITHGNVLTFAEQINKQIKGTPVFFKKSGTMRIVTREGITLDFSQISSDIRNDLSMRDFTINAIAWSPSDGIIDLFDGMIDIEKKRIKCISKKNLIRDPIRILRAYRFAAEFNGCIEKKTRYFLKELHRGLHSTASERITMELFHLLGTANATKYLLMALNDNVLQTILLQKNDLLRKNIHKIIRRERSYLFKQGNFREIKFSDNVSEHLNYKGLLRLSMLIQLHKKPFYASGRLSLSNKLKRKIERISLGIHLLSEKKVTNEKFYDFFLRINDAAQDIAILLNKRDFLQKYIRFRKISKKAYLSSYEIMELSGKKGGKELGLLINKLKKAQFMSYITNRRQAEKLIKKLSAI
jgi:tRNA nucleotidyltransferase/poly(A) polymerase